MAERLLRRRAFVPAVVIVALVTSVLIVALPFTVTGPSRGWFAYIPSADGELTASAVSRDCGPAAIEGWRADGPARVRAVTEGSDPQRFEALTPPSCRGPAHVRLGAGAVLAVSALVLLVWRRRRRRRRRRRQVDPVAGLEPLMR